MGVKLVILFLKANNVLSALYNLVDVALTVRIENRYAIVSLVLFLQAAACTYEGTCLRYRLQLF